MAPLTAIQARHAMPSFQASSSAKIHTPDLTRHGSDQFQLRFGALVTGEGARLDPYQVYWDERLEQAFATATADKMRADLEALWMKAGPFAPAGPAATIKVKHVLGSGQHPLEVIVAPEDLPAALAKVGELESRHPDFYTQTLTEMGPNRNNLRVYDWSFGAVAPANIIRGYQVYDYDNNRLPSPVPMTAAQIDEALASHQVPPYTTKLILKDTAYDANLATVFKDLNDRITVAKNAYEATYPKKAPVNMGVYLTEDYTTGRPYVWVQVMKPSLGAANAILSTALPGYATREIDRSLLAFRKPRWAQPTPTSAPEPSPEASFWHIKMPRLLMRWASVRNAVEASQGQEHNQTYTSPQLPEFVLPVKVSRMDAGAIAYAT